MLDEFERVIQSNQEFHMNELCLASALVVAKAKIDSNPQYRSIVDHRSLGKPVWLKNFTNEVKQF